jgi:hypothetical protein
MGVSYNIQNRGISLTAARYTLRLWVLYVLPFVSGLIISNFFEWSYFWPLLLLLLTLVIIVFNLVVVLHDWYRKPIARYPIVVQLYVACFFGIMLLGKALENGLIYFILGSMFLINTLLGYYYRRNITACGPLSRTLLVINTLFPMVYTLFFLDYHSNITMFIEAPSMISSICLGITYFCGVIVESIYRF